MKRRDFLKGATIISASGILMGSPIVLGNVQASDKPYTMTLNDPHEPTELEMKHVPLLSIPKEVKKDQWFLVKIRVGFKKVHPSTPKHWIDEISLWIDGKEVVRDKILYGGLSAPEAVFRIKLSRDARLHAVGHCNLHGWWMCEAIKVRVV